MRGFVALLFLCSMAGCAEINIYVMDNSKAEIKIEQDRTVTRTDADATVPVVPGVM